MMKIEMKEIPIREIVEGYEDNNEGGVVGYGGKLNIRPPYQREFVYKDKQRDEVINTIKNNFPLNVMYWAKTEEGFELIDGQQRTLSICQYINGDFSFKNQYFHNLTNTEKNAILDYKLMIYICQGNDKERLEWFKVINIAGEKLTNQELRNAIYCGTWVTDAKRYFSKPGGPAVKIGDKLMDGDAIRQQYLEKTLKWAADKDGVDSIEDYMAIHQHDLNATKLWRYYNSVIEWVKSIFPKSRREMKYVEWGLLYNKYEDVDYDVDFLESEVLRLMDDDDVQKNSGIYPYLLTKDERYLNLRAFDDKTKRKVYEQQKHKCKICGNEFEIDEMEADHITPWSEGGHTTIDNCQMLCKSCNRRKSNK